MKKTYLMFLFCLYTSHAYANDWSKPYRTPNSLGSHLELQFESLLSGCNIPLPLTKTTLNYVGKETPGDALSTIPKVLQAPTTLPLGNKVLMAKSHSTGRLFLYLYTDSERTGLFTLDMSRLLPGNYLEDVESFLVQGGMDTVYRQTCSSVISAAATANASWRVPFAAAKAALTSEYGADRKIVFALVRGDFKSPLSNLLDSPNTNKKLYAHLLFWQWYANNPSLVANNYSYLTNLNGVSLYEFQGDKQKTEGDIALKAAAGVPGAASIETSLALRLARESSLKFNKSATYIFQPVQPNADWGQFKTVPGVAGISAFAATANAQAEMASTVIAPGISHTHTQYLSGVPADFCNAMLWTTNNSDLPSASQGTLSVIGAESISDTNYSPPLPSCKFSVAFKPNIAAPGQPAISNVALNYNLKFKAPIGTTHLTIPAGLVNLSTSQLPELRRTTNQSKYVIENQQASTTNQGEFDYGLLWKISYEIKDDPQDPVANSAPGTTSIKMDCPQSISPFILATSTYDPASKAVVLSIRTTLEADLKYDLTSPSLSCSLAGTLDIPMAKPNGGNRVQPKPVGAGIVLFFPPKKKAI